MTSTTIHWSFRTHQQTCFLFIFSVLCRIVAKKFYYQKASKVPRECYKFLMLVAWWQQPRYLLCWKVRKQRQKPKKAEDNTKSNFQPGNDFPKIFIVRLCFYSTRKDKRTCINTSQLLLQCSLYRDSSKAIDKSKRRSEINKTSVNTLWNNESVTVVEKWFCFFPFFLFQKLSSSTRKIVERNKTPTSNNLFIKYVSQYSNIW